MSKLPVSQRDFFRTWFTALSAAVEDVLKCDVFTDPSCPFFTCSSQVRAAALQSVKRMPLHIRRCSRFADNLGVNCNTVCFRPLSTREFLRLSDELLYALDTRPDSCDWAFSRRVKSVTECLPEFVAYLYYLKAFSSYVS